MNKLLITLICWSGLTLAAIAQVPPPMPPTPSAMVPAVTPSLTPALTPAVSPTAPGSNALADRIRNKVDKKTKHNKGFNIQFDGGDDSEDSESVHGHTKLGHDEIPDNVIPIVGIALMAVFGTPVLIVGVIMYFGFSRNRMMHKTVRMMVEKGQPVPAALLNPPVHERKRSDIRRGVVLMMIGVGLVVFLGAVNDWEGGSWSIGIIPLLIGLGYLLVWKLEPKAPSAEAKADNPPPLP